MTNVIYLLIIPKFILIKNRLELYDTIKENAKINAFYTIFRKFIIVEYQYKDII